MKVSLLLVLDVAGLAHPLDIRKARMDPIRRAHVLVRAVMQIADVEIHAMVPEPSEHALAARGHACLARGLLDGLDGDQEVEALDDLFALERRERGRPDDLPAVVEDRTSAVALDDSGVGLDHALAADVLLEPGDATRRDRGLEPCRLAQQLMRGHYARVAYDEEF